MILKKIYSWLYKITARSDEKGEYAGGFIQGVVREAALRLCDQGAGKALEIGTGTGLFLIKLASQNPDLKIWSIDNNDEFLDAAAKKIEESGLENIHLLHQDARDLSFDDDFFDIVICVNFFINVDIDTVIEVLREMARALRPSGRMIFEFRNSRNILFRLKYTLAGYYDPSVPQPLYTYSPDKIDEILKELDLEVIGRKYIGFPVKRFAPIIIVEASKKC